MGFKPTTGGGIDQLTGEVTAGPGTGSQAATIAPVVTAGSIGGATAVPEITYNAAGQITGVASTAPDDTSKVPLGGGTMTGQLIVPDLSVSGLTGATAASRYVGATTSGAPTTGTFAVGDFVIDQTGKVWVCTTAGTPGTWTGVGGSSLTYLSGTLAANVTLTTGAWTTVITTPSLAVGVWQLSWHSSVFPSTAPTAIEEYGSGYNQSGAGTATVSPLGPSQTGAWIPDGAPASQASSTNLEFNGLLQVTAAGTILLQTYLAVAGTAATNDCGYTLVKIA